MKDMGKCSSYPIGNENTNEALIMLYAIRYIHSNIKKHREHVVVIGDLHFNRNGVWVSRYHEPFATWNPFLTCINFNPNMEK